MHIQAISDNNRINTNFKNTNNKQEPPEYYKRFKVMGGGLLLGTAGALVYNKQRNLTGKKLWFNSLEMGSAFAITADIITQAADIPQNIKNKSIPKIKISNEDLKALENKDTFLALYSGENKVENIEKYNAIFMDKELCNKLFQNKKILKASQEALIELNYKKIAEANKNNDTKTVEELEKLNKILKTNTQDENKTKNSSMGSQNPSFKGILDFFHSANEPLKKQAEISVNRYASSAAGVAASLANTGFGDAALLTIITKNMCKKIFKIYGCNGGYVAAITAAAAGAAVGANLATKGATIWPGAGNAINATITYSLHQLEGRALIEFLEENANSLDGLAEADAVAKFGTKVKTGLDFIDNDNVREFLKKTIDKTFDLLL